MTALLAWLIGALVLARGLFAAPARSVTPRAGAGRPGPVLLRAGALRRGVEPTRRRPGRSGAREPDGPPGPRDEPGRSP